MAFLVSGCSPGSPAICSLLIGADGRKMHSTRGRKQILRTSRGPSGTQGTLGSCFNSVRHSERAMYGVPFHDIFLILHSGVSKAYTAVGSPSWGFKQARITIRISLIDPDLRKSTLHRLIYFSLQISEDRIIIPASQMKKLNLRDIKQLLVKRFSPFRLL